jgi:hypothetical protein
MRIGGGSEEAFGSDGHRPDAATAPPASASRALTVIAGSTGRASTQSRGDAGFIAQLIATAAQAPQTRARRRAEPAEVLAAYRAVANLKA